jgi:hypothetical protein
MRSLIKRANEYQMLAEAMPPDDLPADDPPMTLPTPAPVTQPMQQQQTKEDDE